MAKPESPHVQTRGPAFIISPAARQIVQAALREDVSVAELGQMAKSDPAFAIRVLSLANSAAYSVARSVSNIEHACTLLGIRGLRNVALGMLVADLVPAAEGASVLLANCLRRAVAARELARLTGLVHREDGFFAGLLLEVALLHQACDEFDACLEVARAPGRHRVIRERAAGLLPHPPTGAQLARELGLPELMVIAIQEHHAPHRPAEPLAAICWVAETVACVLEAGHEGRSLRLAEQAAEQIGLSHETLHELLRGLPEEVRVLDQALESPAGPASGLREFLRRPEDDAGELHAQLEELVRVAERLMEERDRLEAENDELRRALAEARLQPKSAR